MTKAKRADLPKKPEPAKLEQAKSEVADPAAALTLASASFSAGSIGNEFAAYPSQLGLKA